MMKTNFSNAQPISNSRATPSSTANRTAYVTGAFGLASLSNISPTTALIAKRKSRAYRNLNRFAGNPCLGPAHLPHIPSATSGLRWCATSPRADQHCIPTLAARPAVGEVAHIQQRDFDDGVI